MRITVDQVAQVAAQKYYGKNIINQKDKYNILALGFNLSSVSLIASVAVAILFGNPVAMGVAALTFFARHVIEKEMENYMAPTGDVVRRALHFLGQQDANDRLANLRARVGQGIIEEDALNICGYSILKCAVV